MRAGLFVGGRSARMGGKPKGLLPAPDTGEPLVARLARLAREAGLQPMLVGEASAYRAALPDLSVLSDAPGVAGPLAGLLALLESEAEGRAIALACDLPFVEAPVLARLATQPSAAAVLAPRLGADAPWEPLFARYDAARVLPVLRAATARGVRSFQAVFAELAVERFTLDAGEALQLRDWDSPEDLG
jgi:molybdopterin-guanine dinucleotide biosynthesis protein A